MLQRKMHNRAEKVLVCHAMQISSAILYLWTATVPPCAKVTIHILTPFLCIIGQTVLFLMKLTICFKHCVEFVRKRFCWEDLPVDHTVGETHMRNFTNQSSKLFIFL